jgi:hypothetical protein
MPPHELVAEARERVGDRELALFLEHVGYHGREQVDVPRLLARVRGVALVDGLDELVGLLDDVAPEARGRLLAVPGAAVGRAQALDDRVEPPEGLGGPGGSDLAQASPPDFAWELIMMPKRTMAPMSLAGTK